jgi:hypothetical protein
MHFDCERDELSIRGTGHQFECRTARLSVGPQCALIDRMLALELGDGWLANSHAPRDVKLTEPAQRAELPWGRRLLKPSDLSVYLIDGTVKILRRPEHDEPPLSSLYVYWEYSTVGRPLSR